jgi:hypothetical protein
MPFFYPLMESVSLIERRTPVDTVNLVDGAPQWAAQCEKQSP